MNTYWISLPCDLLSSLASFQCSLLHHLHLSSDLGLSKYVNQHSHLNLSRNVRLPVLYDLDFNKAFFSQQEEISDDDEYANAEKQFSTDPEPEEHSPYSVYQSSFHPKMPQKSFLPRHI